MHVLVLGAGVTGVTTAWYLLNSGFDVSIVDRQSAPGLETTYANGGQISISHPEPWSSPSAPWIALRSLGRKDAPLRVRPGTDMARWKWLAGFLHECLPSRHRRNTEAIAALAAHSGACLRALRERTSLHYEEQTRGILHLFHSTHEREMGQRKLAMLGRHGIRAEILDPAGCATLDPALTHTARQLTGGLYAPDDESGNAMVFTQALAERVRALGGRFHHDTRVRQMLSDGSRIKGIEFETPAGETCVMTADAYVMCLGSFSAPMMAGIGERLPIYPVKGYSVSVPVADRNLAPVVSLTDESRRIVCSRLGDQLRVAGTAEISGFDTSLDASRCAPLVHWIDETFPGATRTEEARLWAGLRPCTPSYVPIIGRARHVNLWLNTGHGSLGWTLACGSGDSIASLMAGKDPAVTRFPFRRN